jgi:hypothetical protein
MRRKATWLWLLATPLLVPLFIWGLQRMQSTRITTHDIGGFKRSEIGERKALKKLADVVHNGQERGKIWTTWDVFKAPQSLKIYAVEFDRSNQRLVKVDCCSVTGNSRQAIATHYTNVTDEAIHAVAAADGIASDVVKHGATLKRHGTAQMDTQGKLILDW